MPNIIQFSITDTAIGTKTFVFNRDTGQLTEAGALTGAGEPIYGDIKSHILEVAGLSSGGIHPPVVAAPIEDSRYIFVREGDYWRVRLGRETKNIKHCIGMNYIRDLLRYAGKEIPVAQLVMGDYEKHNQAIDADDGLSTRRTETEIADAQTIKEAQLKLHELLNKRQERELLGGDTSEIDEEYDQLESIIDIVKNKAGEQRKFTNADKRAQEKVQKAIKRAVDAITNTGLTEAHEVLWDPITTGYNCKYKPPENKKIRWKT